MKNLVIIDADSLIYQSSKNDLKESIDILDEKIQNIFTATEADYYCMFISMGTYFRHRINPTYKANRKSYPSPLLWVRTLKNYLIEKYGAIAGKDVEADDLCKYFYNKRYITFLPPTDDMNNFSDENRRQLFIKNEDDYIHPTLFETIEEVKVILATPDKDILRSTPTDTGHFNYTYKLLEKDNPDSLVKGGWIYTTEEEANEDLWYKMIEGDQGDGISGLHGKGKAFAKRLYASIQAGFEYHTLCLHAYMEHYKNEAEAIVRFQENYRMLYILQNDGDFLREVGYLPEFSYRNVPKQVEIAEETNIEF